MSDTSFINDILSGQILNLVDVGASYHSPEPWRALLKSSAAKVHLFDPNVQNLDYVAEFPETFNVYADVLDETDSVRTLYVTNVDSGSSILSPVQCNQSMYSRCTPNEYFFPIKIAKVRTHALKAVCAREAIQVVDAIKLDTQGSELRILKGLGEDLLGSLIMIEAEVSLMEPHIYSGGATLADMADFFSKKGFQLLNFRPSYAQWPGSTLQGKSGFTGIVEADVLYFNWNLMRSANPNVVRKAIALLCAYGLFFPAQEVLNQSIERGGLSDALQEQILLWQSWFEDRESRGIVSSWK